MEVERNGCLIVTESVSDDGFPKKIEGNHQFYWHTTTFFHVFFKGSQEILSRY